MGLIGVTKRDKGECATSDNDASYSCSSVTGDSRGRRWIDSSDCRIISVTLEDTDMKDDWVKHLGIYPSPREPGILPISIAVVGGTLDFRVTVVAG